MKHKTIQQWWRQHASTIIFAFATLLLLLGYYLMWCEGSDFAHFRPEIFTPTRVRLAPLLCLAAYLLVPCGIMANPK